MCARGASIEGGQDAEGTSELPQGQHERPGVQHGWPVLVFLGQLARAARLALTGLGKATPSSASAARSRLAGRHHRV